MNMPGKSAAVDQLRNDVAGKFWSDDDPNGRWTQSVLQQDEFECSDGSWQVDVRLLTLDPPAFTVTAQPESGELALTAKLAKQPGFKYPGWTYDPGTQTYSTTVAVGSGITLTRAEVVPNSPPGNQTIIVIGTSD
jgi:hypothetical protein